MTCLNDGEFQNRRITLRFFNLRSLYMFRCPPALYDPYKLVVTCACKAQTVLDDFKIF